MAWEENSRICLHMQLIAILSRIGVLIERLSTRFFEGCTEKPAVCSKFRECAKATGNLKSVSLLSSNGLIELFN